MTKVKLQETGNLLKFQIKEKPLSVNRAWQGKRFKTQEYKDYEELLLFTLPKHKTPEGKLHLTIEFGFSNMASDIDNPIKPLLDIMQKRYGFNDKQIYKLTVEKKKVKKGDEYTKIVIDEYI